MLVRTFRKGGTVVVWQGLIRVVMVIVWSGWLRAVTMVNKSKMSEGGCEVAVAVVADVHAESLSPEDSHEGGQGKEAI